MPAKSFKRQANNKLSARDIANSVKEAKDKKGNIITKLVSENTLKKL